MRALISILFISVMMIAFSAKSQTNALKVKLIKKNNQYYEILSTSQVEFSFYLVGIQSENQARNIEKYIRGYRGVEEFNIVYDPQKSEYKAIGTFYRFANWNYFKYMFKLIKVEQVYIENQWKSLDQIITL